MKRVNKLISRATDSFPEIICYYLVVLTLSGLLFSYFEENHCLNPLVGLRYWPNDGLWRSVSVTVGGKIVAIVLMHVVPLIIIPLIVARLLTSVVEDRNQFTHEEQEELRADIKSIKKALGLDEHDGVENEPE